NPRTVIKYDLPKAAHVTLTIYDVLGRKVRTLLDKDVAAGYQSIHWEGKDDRGAPVASGLYLYRIQAAAFIKVKKMMLLR
ncbi:T9SS type A sorting domain-containing protein, partial [candidate division KSB1 bacterium]|nr:T9SS type A sorting domain-containing protein [candidate division KSB1 bacterium]